MTELILTKVVKELGAILVKELRAISLEEAVATEVMLGVKVRRATSEALREAAEPSKLRLGDLCKRARSQVCSIDVWHPSQRR